jgi:Ser/Thr protein kinase RdoA (MazF antagonist)
MSRAGDDERPTRARVADIAAAAVLYDLGGILAPPVEAARGQQGVVWRLQTDRGLFAVKVLDDPVTEQDVAVDVALQTTMLERGVPAPRPLRTPDGDVLATAGEVLLRVATWVHLHPVRLDLDPRQVGAVLATLHRDPLPAEPVVDPWYTEPVPTEDWQATAEALAAAQAPFAAEFAASVPQFEALQPLFRAPGNTQLCHRDLWADNLRLERAGRICVIDWDNGGPAEATQELAMPVVDFCLGAPDRAGALVEAYRRAGGPGRLVDPSDFTMVLAQFGHFALSAGQDWLGTTDPGERVRAEAWFREGSDRPFHRPQLDELLHAVR